MNKCYRKISLCIRFVKSLSELVRKVDILIRPHTTALKEIHIKTLGCTREEISADQNLPFQINVN